MKKSLLLVSVISTSLSFAQGSLTQANEPAIGTSASLFMCDSNVTDFAGVTGNGVTWDYSTILGIPGEMRTIEIIDPSDSPYASDFPNANKAVVLEGFLTNFWTSAASDRRSSGFVFEEPSFGVVKGVFDDDDQLLATYPFALSDYENDLYAGTLYFEFSGIPQSPDATGKSYAKIDGEGTLKLNATTTLNNVIRYVLIDTLHASINLGLPLDIELIRTQYEYYTAQGGLPVFLHSSAVIQQQGAANPLTSFVVVLSSVEPDGYLSIQDKNTVDFQVYPNPANNDVVIKGDFQSASVAIFDQTGKIVLENGSLSTGQALSIEHLKAGIYSLQVTTENGKAVQKLVKK